mmetsp:Transcript_21205/g.29402  ORF Transcript_21205/g.29402 Transcript_21205/m.29402 type:complete len:98 (+) Transcript_21205:1440-1733(+)
MQYVKYRNNPAATRRRRGRIRIVIERIISSGKHNNKDGTKNVPASCDRRDYLLSEKEGEEHLTKQVKDSDTEELRHHNELYELDVRERTAKRQAVER